MQLCGVCSEHVPKYRCPACRIRYCSVSCFKRHKDDDSCHPVKESDSASSSSTPVSNQLQMVFIHTADSEALKGLLRNPHLRRLMMSVDSAEDKAKATKDAMQEPLFVEFADQCLKMIEPTEAENDDDEF
uniref:Zinc finger HIT domain-containing protein 3 n=1 Tax=Sinocyclocheilus anshuiensis TaxID=1608454 RepID=A0A671L629_9TELE